MLQCASIHVLEVEEPDDAGAREAALLLGQFVDPADLTLAWNALVRAAGVTARLRGGFEMRGWLTQLRREGLAISESGETVAAKLELEQRALDRYIAAAERKAASIDLRPLGARIPPIPIEDIDADVEVHDADHRGTTPLLWPFLRRGRAILTGLPGAGKSTALVRIAALIPRIDDWVPIRASLRDVDSMDPASPFRDRLLEAAMRDVPLLDRPVMSANLSSRLLNGAAVLLLDGLDETYQRRAAVVADIDEFLASCSDDLAVLLSTRDVAYGHAATLGWPDLRLAAPDTVDKLVSAVLVACKSAAVLRHEIADDAEWVTAREEWVQTALGANSTLRETPLIPTLLALLAGERDMERLPTARANVMRAVVDSLLLRRDADPSRLRIGELVGDAAVAATGRVFTTEARALVDGNGQQSLEVLRELVAADLATQWSLAPGPAGVTADAAIRFWDEHGIFVLSGAQEVVTPRLPLFSEIGDAMAVVRDASADLVDWVSERVAQGAVESLVLAAGLSSDASEVFASAAVRSGDHDLLLGAGRAYLDGARFDSGTLRNIVEALLIDIGAGGREGWASLKMLLALPASATTADAIDLAIGAYPEEHRVIARASIALLYRAPESLRSDPSVLLAALAVTGLEHLDSRAVVTSRSAWRDFTVDELYGSTIEQAAQLLVGQVDEAADLVVARFSSVATRTSERLREVLEAAGMGERASEATSGYFEKTAQFLANLDYDPDDYVRFLDLVSEIAPSAQLELAERTKLNDFADFLETMLLNEAGSWGRSFKQHQIEVVELVATLGSFDTSVLAAEARIVRDRVEAFGGTDHSSRSSTVRPVGH